MAAAPGHAAPPGAPGSPGTPGDPALTVRGVDKSFAGVHALSGVDFTAYAGRVHALVGENGAGKSTLIKVFTGVHQPDAGEIRLGGEPVSFRAPIDAQRAGISTIYQEVNLVPLMTVAQNLHLGREPRRFGLVDHRAMNRSARDLLTTHGIRVEPTRQLRSLGLGLQQMVAVVRAVSTDARVVVMDEPTSSLEPKEVDQLLELVASLRERGLAVIYVSHKMDELFRVCDDVTVLRDGVAGAHRPGRGPDPRRPRRAHAGEAGRGAAAPAGGGGAPRRHRRPAAARGGRHHPHRAARPRLLHRATG